MKTWLRFPYFCVALSFAAWVSLAAISSAQDAADEKETAAAEADEAAAEATEAEEPEEKDPFALPEDADAAELFEFIENAFANRERTLKSYMACYKAVISATEKIRATENVSAEDEMKALKQELEALKFGQRFDPEFRKKLAALIEQLEVDDRPEFKRIATIENFASKIAKLRGASEEKIQETVEGYIELVGDEELTKDLYILGSSLADVLSKPGQAEIAAGVYEFLSERMARSSDENLSSRAERTFGASRRVRLPGNQIEIVCPTADGTELDWASYRGKVVLVDFWASWCGPCRAEIPNMKRNLEAYGTDAFDIVGVNLDRSKAAMDRYVEQNELTWTNLISGDESKMGWDNPMATYYGINGIPTAILVDQKGRVVSMRARGEELDRLLEELLGKPKNVEPEEAEETETEESEAEEGDAEEADEEKKDK